MPLLRPFWDGLRNLFGKRRAEREMDDELRHYLDAAIQDNLRTGMSRTEAVRAARVHMGSFEAIKDEVRSAGWESIVESLSRDVRYGLRTLRANGAFSAVVVLTLALGIGANTAIFSLFNAVILRSLPVEKPEELIQVGRRQPRHAGPDMGTVFTNPLWEQIRDRQNVFSGSFAWSDDRMDMAQGGAVQYVETTWVSGDYFRTLGVRPAAGRLLTADDDRRGCAATAVLSYDFWRVRFGGQDRAIGGNISLDHRPFQILGVASPGFFGATVGKKFDVAIPLCAADVFDAPARRRLDIRAWWWLDVAGRLKPGVTAAQAQAGLAAISPAVMAATVPPRWDAEGKKQYQSTLLSSTPAATGVSYLRTQFAQPLKILMAIVGMVLLIACANIASLLMARSTSRLKEVAVRLALGASRWRLIRQLLTESLMLSAAGALLGVLIARWASAVLVGYISTYSNSVFLDLSPDTRVLAFTAAVTGLTGVLFGILPAFRSTRVSLTPAMRGDTEAGGRAGFTGGKWMVAAQLALSLALVAAAGLLLRSFANLALLDMGFDRQNVLLVNATFRTSNVVGERRLAAANQIEERLRNLPGVRSAGLSWNTPVTGMGWNQDVISDAPGAPKGEDRLTWFNFISPGYFETLRSPLLSGRNFTARDTKAAPKVAIVTQTMARRFFPNIDPIGRYIHVDGEAGEPAPSIQVVGVVKDSKYESLREKTAPIAFFPLSQMPGPFDRATFELRTAVSPMSLATAVQGAVDAVDKSISIDFRKLSDQVSDNIVTERVLALLSAFFGGLALLLAMVGLYGTLSYLVAQRKKEFGVRMALGAQPASIVSLVMRDMAAVLAGGVIGGLAIALASSGLLRKMLFGLAPRDGVTMSATVILLCAVALAAAWLPARRAARTDPMNALRHE
jgi:putative ABC transport system permease protein